MFGIGRLTYAVTANGSIGGCGKEALSSISLLFPCRTRTILNNTTCTKTNNSNFKMMMMNKKKKKKRKNINSTTCFCTIPGQVTSPSLVALEYAELDLKDKIGEVGHVRIRQHVNPLSRSMTVPRLKHFTMVPVEVPEWKQVFRDPTLPLMVDIGSGSGRFLIWLAKRAPETRNYLGLELRYKLVDRAQFWVKELALSNIYFMFANAMISFEELVSTYPGPLTFVSILCPDPHFKKKHHKRRVVQKELVDSILKNLSPGGQVFVQSDVLHAAVNMRDQFDAHSEVLQHIDSVDDGYVCDADGWLLSNPMGIRTEREIHAEAEGATIYRRLYRKRSDSA